MGMWGANLGRLRLTEISPWLYSVSPRKSLDSRPTLNLEFHNDRLFLRSSAPPVHYTTTFHFSSYITVISGRPVRIWQYKMALRW